ncbi:phosphoenolpyruvate--protein phosphotransferase [Haloactinopolyspora alba]|uniref:Phosphoenolpyruvate-protein phosphotransferase n=1 Tax=Haloactinopolyspora alba TaxID=648780 RepID=A0A2P8DYW6_9ACTN|nr:phosphoenolpyruvate--protein phosphotransferase [Haloactinopolyspora alba]PSL02400.1 phosphoenolpyruvate--protein phosphotransferase [Haloactinopolyspora alba]
MPEITGVGVSPGRAVAPLVRMPEPVAEPPSDAVLPAGADVAGESERVAAAAEEVRQDLERRAARAHGDGQAVLEATALMAADPTLVSAAQKRVADGTDTSRAVWDAAAEVTTMLESLGGYMAERARDVADVRDRVVAVLNGRPAPGVPQRDEPFVLAARDLAPADTATLDPATCVALVTAEGGPTSHTAILARSLGLPAVVAASGVLDIAEAALVLVDGAAGSIETDPSPEQVRKVEAARGRERHFDGTGRTADGHRVQLLANVGDGASAVAAAEMGAEGVGLFRTEFCFLDRADEPTVDDQAAAYEAVLSPFSGRKVVVRTLDAGADKPLPFLTDASEENPALGVRGYRTTVRHPEVLEHQLEAIARAGERSGADVWVMAPMVSTAGETEQFVATAHRHGVRTAGVMVEVPAAALAADAVMQRVAFASIGTNDLTQYAMAADRLLGDLAGLNDPWQPAALQLVRFTAEAGARLDRPVGVCGEAAADPALSVVLVGLGVTSLSMTPRAIADVAEVLLSVSRDECVRLAGLALAAPDARSARAAVRAELPVLDDLGL